MKKYLILPLFLSFILLVNDLSVAQVTSMESHKSPVAYVNPFIGTAAYGHTFPGAALPFSMVQVNPSTGAIRDKGYSYSDVPHGRESDTILGFTHTYGSGGFGHVGTYGQISFMPTAGPLQIEPGSEDDPESGYRSRYSHDFEEASPGYYRVLLQDYSIDAEVTLTERATMHRYTFPQTDEGHIIIDITRERMRPELHKEAFIEVIGDNRIRGYTTVIHPGYGEPTTWYFFAEFDKPFESFGTFLDGEISENRRQARGTRGVGAYVDYTTADREQVLARVGISFTGMEGAERNLRHEIRGWDFDQVRREAEKVWDEQLRRVEVSGGTEHNKVKFYTALYHSLLFPRLFSDADGAYYSHFKDDIVREDDFRYYIDFSLWDTYRTTQPLLDIIEPERKIEMIKTLLTVYDQGGWVPGQFFKNHYQLSMIGDHGVTAISDAYMKGIRDFDVGKAYEAMSKNAFERGVPGRGRMGMDTYGKLGYAEAGDFKETVSVTLEYSHTDWALAQVARDLGKSEDYEVLMSRAGKYKNLYDSETGFYRPKLTDGKWVPACERGRSPGIVTSSENSYYDCWHPLWIGVAPHRHYTESNAWQYLFYPQHDIHGLIDLMGGRERFVERLDGLFYTSSSNLGPSYIGVTGAIGQYVHGNQPSFHKAFLYTYAGAPWKTQGRVRGIMDTLYGVDEWGYPGNEDHGSMAAWFVFSALGIYPVTPGLPAYTITSPLFESAVINLSGYYGERKLAITAHDNSGDNKYIQSVMLNGEPLPRPWITHEEIVNGGTLEFQMGSEPNREWGVSSDQAPPSMSKSR